MDPLGLNSAKLGKDLDIPSNRISQILQGKRSMTVDTALRLEIYFKVSAEFWLDLQKHYDLEVGKDMLWDQLRKILNQKWPKKRRREKLLLPNTFSTTRAASALGFCLQGQVYGLLHQRRELLFPAIITHERKHFFGQ